jgi:hypothetical protein
MQVLDLIQLAENATGSTSALARRLDVPNPVVFGWKNGSRTCTAEDRALLADIAGVDPFPEIAAAMLERWDGKPKGEALKRILARGQSRI